MPRLTLALSVLLACSLLTPLLHAAPPPVSLAQLAELTPTQRANQDWFGFSIAISGNTVVVGAFDANIESFGKVYVYVKPLSGWANMTQVATLTASDNGQGFGTSVAISGDTIVVGAANTSNFERASTPGAVYVFVRSGANWTDMTETAKLTASDAQPGDALGVSVSISADIIAAGAFFAQDASGNDFAGKAYVFVRPGSGWSGNLHETARLTASDSQLLNYMGASIATNGHTVVAGSYGHNNFQGVGYVFVKPPTGWANMTQTAELSASDGGTSNDLGFSAAINNGNTIVLGAPGAAHRKGAGYVYVRPGSGWSNMTETAELRYSGATQDDSFGQSVAFSGNVVVIGAPSATVGGNFGQGAAYVYLKPSNGWRKTTKANAVLSASDGLANDGFGLSVGISGTTFVAGAIGNSHPGAAYVFGRLNADSGR